MNQNKIKIAVVDDDEGYACALERLFRASGFEVRTYCSAETFLAAPPLPGPDCLVLDVHLGGMSGLGTKFFFSRSSAATSKPLFPGSITSRITAS